MTQLGMRAKRPFPCTYKGFHVMRSHGRVYAVPCCPGEGECRCPGRPSRGPVLSASTTEELETLIRDFDITRHQPPPVASYEGYNLVRHRDTIYGVPQAAGPV